jgi:polyisoprenoid-binding protein YceI
MGYRIGRAAMASAAVLAFVAAATAQSTVSSNPNMAPAGRYKVSAAHTQVVFAIMHMGLTPYYGRWSGLDGKLQFDPAAPEKSSVTVTIPMNSVNTPSDRVNTELCSASTFNCAANPTATFKSTSIHRTGDHSGDITGDLTLAGVTKSVTLHTTFNGGTKRMDTNAYMLGFSATATIRRSDFGLTKMSWAPFVADDVALMIAAEFAEDKE